MSFNWSCPYCGRDQTVTDERTSTNTQYCGVSDVAEGNLVVRSQAIGCANPKCKRLTLRLSIGRQAENWGIPYLKPGTEIIAERLLPRGAAKPQPSYIPKPLVDDYTEACLIRDLSPKASATLARRCLQGMIRDFAGIAKSRLIDEVKELQKRVDDGTADRSISPESVEAIDHVRSIGNVGAHMEKDINTIVPVDPDEAQLLIGLIELLFEEWYTAREVRKDRLAKIAKVRAEKDALKGPGPVADPTPPAAPSPVPIVDGK